MNFSQKVYVNHVSLESAIGDYEPRVYDDEVDSSLYQDEVLSRLDDREKEIAQLIFDGYNFLEISKKLKLKESQIYKVKKTLAQKLGHLHTTSTPERIGAVVKLYFTGKLKNMARHIYTIWNADPALREYERPTQAMIEDYIEDVLLSVGGGAVVYRLPKRKQELYNNVQQLNLFQYEYKKQAVREAKTIL